MIFSLGAVLLSCSLSFQADDGNAALIWMANHRVSEATVSPLKAFGVSSTQLQNLDDAVAKAVIQPNYDFAPGKYTVQNLAEQLKGTALQLLGESGIESNEGLTQRIEASAISSWVRTHLVYNEALASPTPEVPHDVKALYWTSSTLLKQKNAWAVCAGYSRLTLDLSKALELPCFDVLGVIRGAGNRTPKKWTHSWNVFVFRGKEGRSIVTPCDTTISRVSLKTARSLDGRIHHLNCFPNTAWEWGYFLWRQRCTANDGDKPVPDECRLDDLNEEDWRNLRLPLEQFIQQVERFEAEDTVRVAPPQP